MMQKQFGLRCNWPHAQTDRAEPASQTAVLFLNHKTMLASCFQRAPIEMATVRHALPGRRQRVLQAPYPFSLSANMLQQVQPSATRQDPADLCERQARVLDRAKRQRSDDVIKG